MNVLRQSKKSLQKWNLWKQINLGYRIVKQFGDYGCSGLIMKPERIMRWDKTGKPFEIGTSCAEDFPALLEMYRIFYPKPASQGLPPEDPETCHNWVENLFEIGKNFLAWIGDTVIGHAVLVPDIKGKSGEFVIFIHQHHRNVGSNGTQDPP
jgi:hypothetical protein